MVNKKLKVKRVDLLNAITLKRDNGGQDREPFLLEYSPPIRGGCDY
jgi:hypothetical protein